MRLSKTSKMPCDSFGLPANSACKTGGKLAQIPGSVCHKCYADGRGNYRWNRVKALRADNLEETLKALKGGKKAQQAWVLQLVGLIMQSGKTHFRWHDSGDLQSELHLELILEVCRLTPDVKHWLPTREYAMVQNIAFEHAIPANLVIRLSAHMIGRTIDPSGGFPSSSVDAGVGWQCPAGHNPKHKGQCLSCRACWNADVGNIDYRKH